MELARRIQKRCVKIISTLWGQLKAFLRKLQTRWARMNPRLQKGVGVFVLLLILFELAVFLVPLPWVALQPPSSTLVFDREGRVLRAFTSADGMWRIRTDLDQVSPLLQKYLVFYEDRWFYYHPGVNPVALIRAFVQNLRSGRIISGGSTLTMQIARMMEPKARTWQNKLIEMFRALQLEHRFTKEELLTIYFNIAPYGGNIEGVAAAAWLYFGKEPTQLSPGEAALLTVLPNSPTLLRPDLAPDRARQARDKVLKRLYDHGLIAEAEYGKLWRGSRPPAGVAFSGTPLQSRTGYPLSGAAIYTTIDRDLQVFLEELLALEVAKLKTEGITNAAAVVIDNQTHQLMAAVGSAEFFNEQDQGQVNGYLAPRSPGSTLKPFVYALAFERGLLTPAHYVEDVPVIYSGYSPENYDSTYSGLVSAQEALQRSLNVPAVNLLAALGGEALYELLKKAGFTTLTPVNHYGLPMVLVVCEINLLELANLYASLANGGKIYPVQTRLDQHTPPPITLFSPGVAYVITEILTEVRRPDLPTCWEFTTLPKVAWKTGTSYGHKDAWSIGYNPRYTVGVWVGNFSGVGRAGLNGAEKAAPLLFTIFAHLNSKTAVSWFTPPATVKKRAVCAVSGQTPGPFCTRCAPIIFNRLLAGRGVRSTDLSADPATGYAFRPIIRPPGTEEQFICSIHPGCMAGSERTTGRNPPACSRSGKRSYPAVLRWCVRPRRIMFIKSAAGFPWSIRKSALKRRRATMCNASTGLPTGSYTATPNRENVFYVPDPVVTR